jgi:hypothetical protein
MGRVSLAKQRVEVRDKKRAREFPEALRISIPTVTPGSLKGIRRLGLILCALTRRIRLAGIRRTSDAIEISGMLLNKNSLFPVRSGEGITHALFPPRCNHYSFREDLRVGLLTIMAAR